MLSSLIDSITLLVRLAAFGRKQTSAIGQEQKVPPNISPLFYSAASLGAATLPLWSLEGAPVPCVVSNTGSGPTDEPFSLRWMPYGVAALNWMRWPGTRRSLSMLIRSFAGACGPMHAAAVRFAPGSNPFNEVLMR